MEVGSDGGDRWAATQLTVVIPAFNEEDRLGDGLARLQAAAVQGALDLRRTEVLVVDDGSADRTAAVARDLIAPLPCAAVLQLDRHRGKGAAVRAGVRAAASPQVAFVDADMAMDPVQLPDLAAGLDHRVLSIGDRTLPGSSVDVQQVGRTLGTRAFNRIVHLLTGIGLRDTQCGFKAFRTPAARLLFHCASLEGFAFDVEVLSWARRFGLGIAQVPVRWRRVGGSHVHASRDAARMLGDVVAYRLGRRPVPPVPTLTVRRGTRSEEPTPAAVAAAAGPTLPVLRGGDGEPVVLLALCGPQQAEAVRLRVAQALPGAAVGTGEVTVAELQRLAPLALEPTPAASRPDAVTSPPGPIAMG